MVIITCDSGAQCTCITHSECKRLGLHIYPSKQKARQLDKSVIPSLGEVRGSFTRGPVTFHFTALVVTDLNDATVLAGMDFLKGNKMKQDFVKDTITVNSKYVIQCNSNFCPTVNPQLTVQIVTFDNKSTLFPGDSHEIRLSPDFPPDRTYLIEPRNENCSNSWIPQTCTAVGNTIKITNDTTDSIVLKKDSNCVQVRMLQNINEKDTGDKCSVLQDKVEESIDSKTNSDSKVNKDSKANSDSKWDLQQISIDPKKVLTKQQTEKVLEINSKYSSVFDNNLTKGYNNFSGRNEANFDFLNNSRPPVNHGKAPIYAREKDMHLLQAKIDELEEQGVVARATDLDVIPRYATPCMLVLKGSAAKLEPGVLESLPIHEKLRYYRFVQAFNQLNEYVAKQPASYTTVNETIKKVGQYQWTIETDMTDSYFQRHMSPSKWPWMCFVSPFKGVYVMKRTSQGFINSAEGLTELVSGAVGHLAAQGKCVVHADNLWVGGDTVEEALENWKEVLASLAQNNLKLNPAKTIIFAPEINILGHIKEGRMLKPDPHRQLAISKATIPKTVKQLRSYLGSYKTFSKFITNMAMDLGPLEDMQAGKGTSETLSWSQQQQSCFEESKLRLPNMHNTYIPKNNDQLVITKDWAKKGLGATLWVYLPERPQKWEIVDVFSARLKTDMANWPCCDGEGAAAAVACKAFSSHLRESEKPIIVLSDNRPVYTASKLLKNGKFSTSPRLNSLLTCINEFNVQFQPLSGKMGQNPHSDALSRQPNDCNNNPDCQTCRLIEEATHLAVGVVICDTTLTDAVLKGVEPLPFFNRNSIRKLQQADPDLIRVYTYLSAGKKPQRRDTKCNTVKRYLQFATIAQDDTLVVRQYNKLVIKELPIVPVNIAEGLVIASHYKLNHPTPSQHLAMIKSNFFVLNASFLTESVWKNCVTCQSIKKIPKEFVTSETNVVPSHPGESFTADVLKKARKCAMITVDNHTGFLSTALSRSEKQDDLEQSLIATITPFKSSTLTSNIRVDQAPGFKAIFKNPHNLSKMGINLELADQKNKDGVAIVDRKIQELEIELSKISPEGDSMTVAALATATAVVNERIRKDGFSARERMFQRDQNTLQNLPIDDLLFAKEKQSLRDSNIIPSAKSKASTWSGETQKISVGSVVFIKTDGDKHKAREMHLVTSLDKNNVNYVFVQKLIHSFSDSKPGKLQPILYHVKKTSLYLVPNQTTSHLPPNHLPEPHDYLPPPVPQLIPHQEEEEDDSDDDTYFFMDPFPPNAIPNMPVYPENVPPLIPPPPPLPIPDEEINNLQPPLYPLNIPEVIPLLQPPEFPETPPPQHFPELLPEQPVDTHPPQHFPEQLPEQPVDIQGTQPVRRSSRLQSSASTPDKEGRKDRRLRVYQNNTCGEARTRRHNLRPRRFLPQSEKPPDSPYHLLTQWETQQRESARLSIIDTKLDEQSQSLQWDEDDVFSEEDLSLNTLWHQRTRFSQLSSVYSSWGRLPTTEWDHDPICYEFSQNYGHQGVHHSSTDPHLLDATFEGEQPLEQSSATVDDVEQSPERIDNRRRSASLSETNGRRKRLILKHRAFSVPLDPTNDPRYNEPWAVPDLYGN